MHEKTESGLGLSIGALFRDLCPVFQNFPIDEMRNIGFFIKNLIKPNVI